MDLAETALIGVISIGSLAIGWFLNSRTAQDTQERQQRHELAMQAQELEAERKSATDDALRAMKHDRLEPAFAALADLERELSYLSMCQTINGLDFAPSAKKEVIKEIARRRPTKADMIFDLESAALRIGDEALAKDVLDVWGLLIIDNPDTAVAGKRLRNLYARLEAYTASLSVPE